MGKALLIILAILIPIVGIWWLARHRLPTMALTVGPSATTVPNPNPAANNTSAVESMIQKATGVPVAAVGKIASSQPTAVKLAFATTIGVTALAHNLITNPKGEVKQIAKTTVAVTKTVAKDTAKVAVGAVKLPFALATSPVKTTKAIGSSIKSGAKSVASGAKNTAKSIGSAISHIF